jgi:hypothetical protein
MAFDPARWEAGDAKNRPEAHRIFDRYGWVTDSLGRQGRRAQPLAAGSSSDPEIQQRLVPALEKADKEGDASMSDYAYLYDRVQMV